MIRVCIVDDQQLMRTGFEMILAAHEHIEVVGMAADGRSGVSTVRAHNPDVVLMDIRMPDMDGLEATKVIVDDPTLDTRVLVLTTFHLDDYVYGAIRSGASGFLLKDSPTDELLRAIELIADGEALLAPAVTRTLIEEFARTTPADPMVPTVAIESLTDRESQVWQLIAQGMSNQEIAQELILGETTVKTHVSRVLMKLGVRDRVQAVVAAYESGVIRPGDAG